MRGLLTLICMFVLLASAGCWGSAGTDESIQQNANAAYEPLPEYSDANVALADGTKFLDTGETDKAIDALNQAVKLNPDLAEAWFRLGIAYGLAEIRDKALAVTDANTTPSPTGTREVKKNSEIAFEKAVAAYKKIIEANEEDHAAYYNLGRAYNKLNEDEDAAKALKQAVKLYEDDTEYQTELGAILIKLAQYQEAVSALKKALELDPENIRAQELLEDAEAGRKRVSYSSTPKEEKKSGNSNTTNSNAAPSPSPDSKLPPPTPVPSPAGPRPSPTRPT
ncbi:MAG TPA: tetratricopeptide repeat protein [Pyrinomonadaceae bacterium]